MTEQEKELFAQAEAEYRQALIGATRVWKEAQPTVAAPHEVLQSTAATILIHMKDIRRNTAPVAGNRAATLPEAPAQAPVAVPTDCPECGGPMYDNRNDKKHDRSPDFKCKDPECNKAIWLTPPKGRPRAVAGR